MGGTWERIKDTFLLASGDTYQAGQTGGEASHVLSHDEMPTHSHKVALTTGQETTQRLVFDSNWSWKTSNYQETYLITSEEGKSEAHNNLPPYLVVYVWQRTA